MVLCKATTGTAVSARMTSELFRAVSQRDTLDGDRGQATYCFGNASSKVLDEFARSVSL